MADRFIATARKMVGGAAVAALTLTTLTGAAFSQGTKTVRAQDYVPTIWVDPDGCEHWVMDDGAEGYMSPHLTRQGLPVCRDGYLCGELNSDQFFASGSSALGAAGRKKIAEFFKSANAQFYIVTGHTDNRGSDEANMALSFRRAAAVAKVGAGAGADIADVRAYGERNPRASNRSSKGRAENRRVEIMCIR
ncbi:OmpA family protein [Cognatishimia sp. WU-CL00825]|uniref:OmpA family protein n=1 Tax=Cognatishimia sp. WU-CL00825 TaxID=3127658 RepID=UPI00336530EF